MIVSWLKAQNLDNRLDPYRYSPEFLEVVNRIKSYPSVRNLSDAREHGEPINYGILQPREFLKFGGVPMIRAVDLGNPFIDKEDVVCVPKDVELPYRRSRLNQGDVLIAIAGTLGTIGICPPGWQLANINQSVARLRVNESHDPYFIAAYLMTEIGQLLLMREAVGTVQRHFNLEDLPNVLIPCPGLPIEQAIGNMLRKAERLRLLMQSVRRNVDDWVKKATKYGLFPEKDQDYLDHSPDKTCADAGWIAGIDAADRIDPWPHHVAPRRIRKHLKEVAGARPLTDFFEKVSANRKKSHSGSQGHYHISILDVDSDGFIDWDAASKSQIEGAGIEVNAGDVLFPGLNPKETRVCVIPDDLRDTAYASPEFIILRLRSDIEQVPYLLTALLRSSWVRVQTAFLTRSSSLSRRRLQEDDLWHVLIPWHDDSVIGLNAELLRATGAKQESIKLIEDAKSNVEALIDGTLDKEVLLRESDEIERWLKKNPVS